jgi:hypothetical protein
MIAQRGMDEEQGFARTEGFLSSDTLFNIIQISDKFEAQQI